MLKYNEINRLRKLKGIKFDELAKLMEYHPNGFRAALKNNTLTLDKITKLAEILGVHINQIYYDETQTNTTTEQHNTYKNTMFDTDLLSLMQQQMELIKSQITIKDQQINKLLDNNKTLADIINEKLK